MTFKSGTIAIVAATLALSSVGSAFAQDRFQPGPDRDGRYQQRNQPDQRGGGDRFDHRNDRQDFRDGRQFDRRGFASPRTDWRRGGRVPPEYRGRNYVVDDWRGHHLNAPPRGY